MRRQATLAEGGTTRCRKHDWRRLFESPWDTESSLTYHLRAYGRYAVCVDCRKVGLSRRYRGGFNLVHPDLAEDRLREAQEWNAQAGAAKGAIREQGN